MDTIDFKIERLILKAGNTLNTIRTDDLRQNNLTPAQSEAILFYCDNGGKSIKDLAAHLKITHQAASKLTEKLKEKNILTAHPAEEDKRFFSIFLTDCGQELCSKLKEKGSIIGNSILDNISDQEKELLLTLMLKIENNIDKNKM